MNPIGSASKLRRRFSKDLNDNSNATSDSTALAPRLKSLTESPNSKTSGALSAISTPTLLLSAAVGGFLLQHAVSGWCPPIPLLRRLGVRTRSELDREKFALKALRGDFKSIDLPERRSEPKAPSEALQAVNS
jgi:hypothetical protein